MEDTFEERSRKRQKLDAKNPKTNQSYLPRTLTSTISPPPLGRTKMEGAPAREDEAPAPKINLYAERRRKTEPAMVKGIVEDQAEDKKNTITIIDDDDDGFVVSSTSKKNKMASKSKEGLVTAKEEPAMVDSPFHLTWIRDLPASSNKGAIALKDILGDPLITECWEFNYMHDLDFLMNAFDEDTRNLVKVNVVHGYWKNEDRARVGLKEQAIRYPNISLLTAFMPEMFGTHHTKMLVLFRADDTAQIVIHTANMIEFDWANMTQGLWKSPLLPKITKGVNEAISDQIGSGWRFKNDFLNYLRAYDTKRTICKPLIEHLLKYNFSGIKAALIGSVPGKQSDNLEVHETAWGWRGLREVLKEIPAQGTEPEIVIQISSIASLSEKWINTIFLSTLGKCKSRSSKPSFKIVFPTAEEIRRSLNGYGSGSAIHIKIQSAPQQKQLVLLKPMLCYWAGDVTSSSPSKSRAVLDAGRKRAAPHIKTYTRFSDSTHHTIDWQLLTSANLSKQAWGEAPNAEGEVRIASYELGVLVWPELLAEGEKAVLVPTFKTDEPEGQGSRWPEGTEVVVGARMCYDLPLVRYEKDEEPWCATKTYEEPDWMGRSYEGYNSKQ